MTLNKGAFFSRLRGWRVMIVPLMVALVVGVSSLLLIHRLSVIHRLAQSKAIYPNVYIYGVDVGGLTKAEAEEKLGLQRELDKKTIQFTDGGEVVVTLTFKDFGAHFILSAVIDEAWQYGRSGNVVTRFRQISGLSRKPLHITRAPDYGFDDALLVKMINQIAEKRYKAPLNASMTRTSGVVTAVPGQEGRAVNKDAAAKQVRALLAARQEGTVALDYVPVPPMYKASDLAFDISCIGQFESKFYGKEDDPRLTNIRIAAGRINNQTLYPDEIFSAAALIDAGSPDSGYARATVIVNGQAIDDYGGGVCQVVTTLYNAVLYAELPVVERHNHSVKVSYADFGFDATIAGDYFDFKFKNDTPYPMLVACDVENGRLTVRLYGFEVHKPGRSLAFHNELAETTPPAPEKVLTDASLSPGRILVATEPRDGYRYDVYKYVYENGHAMGKEKINTSVYKPVQGVVTVGRQE